MLNQGATLTLSIHEVDAAPRRAFLYHVTLNDTVLAANRDLSPADSGKVREVAQRYLALFEGQGVPQSTGMALQSLGADLFELWLGKVWADITAQLPTGTRWRLVIASKVAAVLNLPWELLLPPHSDRLPHSDFLGCNPLVSICRRPWVDKPLQPFSGQLPPKPLRILFMACAPQDQPDLNYEREEAALLKAIARARADVVFDSGDLGTFEELRLRINEFSPQVVHLTGHGIVRDDGLGYFAFEDERGNTDLRSSQELAQEVFAGSDVQCAFMSGCQTGAAPAVAVIGGLCQGLVAWGVPLAVGFAAAIADDLATRFAQDFYTTLASGRPVSRALIQARQTIRGPSEQRNDPSWTLPVLYSASTQDQVVDLAAPPTYAPQVQERIPGKESGYTSSFVGRRRELQRLLPALQDGKLQRVLLTGVGGAGKTTLATRLVNKLRDTGFTPIALFSSQENPLSAARLLESCWDAFLQAELRDAYNALRDASVPVEDRLHYLVNVLNKRRFVLLLDNLEVNLDEQKRHFLDPQLAQFFVYLLQKLVGGSRLLVTSRYRPAELERLQHLVHVEELGDFPESTFLKFLLQEPRVEQRYAAGDLPTPLLSSLHRMLGGTPRFLEQIRKVLKEIPREELEQALEGITPVALAAERDRYCESIFLTRLYSYLSPSAQRGLCQAAVYGVAVPLEGLAAVAGEPVEVLERCVKQWQAHALASVEQEQEVGSLWMVYGVVRGWLMAEERLRPEERRQAHQAAGDFLRKLEEADREGEVGLSWVECLREARAQYLAAGDWEQARATTRRISGALLQQGLYEEVIRLNSEVLRPEEHPGPMNWLGRASLGLTDYAAAREWYERALTTARDKLLGEAAIARYGLATIDLESGNHEAARKQFKEVLQLQQQLDDPAAEASALHQLATIDLRLGNFEAAQEQFKQVLQLRRQLGDRAGEASALHQLATIDLESSNHEAARKQFKEVLQLQQQLDDPAAEASALHQLATIDLRLGNFEAAQEQFKQVLQLRRQLGDRAGEVSARHQLATIEFQIGNHAAAQEQFKEVLQLRQQLGDRAGEASALHQLATIELGLGNHEAAQKQFKEVLRLHQQLAKSDLESGNHAAAQEQIAQVLQLQQQLGDRAAEAATRHQLATIHLRLGNFEAAQEQFKQVLQLRRQLGDRAGEAATWYHLGRWAATLGRLSAGLRLIALCYLLNRARTDCDTGSDYRAVADSAAQLNYTPNQLEEVLRQVEESYRADQGMGMLEAAFGKEGAVTAVDQRHGLTTPW